MSSAQRFRAREPLLGNIYRTPGQALAEVMAREPLDCVCVDMEHSALDMGTQGGDGAHIVTGEQAQAVANAATYRTADTPTGARAIADDVRGRF